MVQAARLSSALLLVLIGPRGVAGAEELTSSDFEEKVFGGKSAFVKFLAPW